MESFLRRALHFFNHDRLYWFVEAVWYLTYACVKGASIVAALSFPLVFGVLYRQVPSFFSHPPVAYATLAILLTGNALLVGAFEDLTVKMLDRLYAPATDLLYWFAGSYHWVMLHLLLSWMRLSMFLESRWRSLRWFIHDLRFAPSRYRSSRYDAGYKVSLLALRRRLCRPVPSPAATRAHGDPRHLRPASSHHGCLAHARSVAGRPVGIGDLPVRGH